MTAYYRAKGAIASVEAGGDRALIFRLCWNRLGHHLAFAKTGKDLYSLTSTIPQMSTDSWAIKRI
ncbi:MAG: hypothetical protein WBA57_25655 [Elainellaceae cyanobacterium]